MKANKKLAREGGLARRAERRAPVAGHWASSLRALLRSGEVRTLFQPIFELGSAGDRPFAFEALTRGPSGSALEAAPALFGSARREGREIETDRVCIASALLAAGGLPDATAHISLNVHARTVARDPTLLPFIEETAGRAGIDLRRLVLEVVEHLIEPEIEDAARNLDTLRRLGIQVAVDDFGSGDSRLYLLHALRPDFIKIDRRLLEAARAGGRPRTILDLVIRHGHRRNARSVVEGIQTEADLELARDAGAELVQGFFVGKPRAVPTHRLHSVADSPADEPAPSQPPVRPAARRRLPAERHPAADWAQLRALDLPLLRFSATGELVDLNDAARALLGESPREGARTSFSDLFQAPVAHRGGARPSIGDLGPDGRDLVWTSGEGARRQLRVRPVRADDRDVFLLLETNGGGHWSAAGLFETFASGVYEQAMIVLDSRGRITEWNEGAIQLLGYTKTAVLHRPFHELLPASNGSAAAELERMLAMARADLNWQGEVEVADDRGERRQMRLTILPLRTQEGRTLAFAIFTLDLTVRIRMEREIESRERRLAMNLQIFEALLEQRSKPVIAARSVKALGTQLSDCTVLLHLIAGAKTNQSSRMFSSGTGEIRMSRADLIALCDVACDEEPGSLVISDVRADERVAELRPVLLERQVGALLSARVGPTEEPIAYVAACSRADRLWSPDEIQAFDDAVRALSVALTHLRTIRRLKSAERRASEREAQLRALTDALPAAVYQAERRGSGPAHLRHLSAGFKRLFGRAPHSVGSFADLGNAIGVKDRSILRDVVERSRASGQPWEHDLEVKQPDGSTRWIRATAARQADERGELETWSGILLDVTETKLAIDRLSQARNEWTATVDAVSDMIVLEDSQGRLLRCNRAVSEYFGKPYRDLLGADLMRLFLGPEASARDRSIFRVPQKTTRLGNGSTWYEISNFAVREGQVSGSYWVHVLVDVTDRRRFEEEVRRLAAAIEQTAEGILVTDPRGRIEYMNAAYGRIAAVDPVAVKGKSMLRVARRMLDRDGIREIFQHLGADGRWSGERTLRAGDRPVRQVQVTISPVRDQEGHLSNYVFVCSDVTERNRLQAIADAVNISEQTGFIFATLRHEIGNPINSIKAALSVLRRNFADYPRELVASYLNRTSAEVSKVEYLLKLFKAFGVNERLRIETIPVPSLIDEFGKLIRADLNGRGISFQLDVPEDTGSALCDPRALSQALLNVVTNAADAVQEVEGANVSLVARRSDARVEIWISDNGAGLTEAELRNIFKPFYTTKEKGTGLGLPLVRKLLTRMGGTVDVHSQPGQGTEVVITLQGAEEER